MKHTVTEVKLDNGARGLFIHIPDASVMTFEVNFRAGEYLVPRDKWEIPHLMEHILLGANQLFPKARAFQAEFEKNGAYSNASTGSYDIIYEAECADFEWDRIADLLLTAISKPLFLEEEFTAEFGNVREELTARSNNHFRHLSLALRQAFGFMVLTDQERLQVMDNVKLPHIKAHYKDTHVTKNLRFIVAGKLPPSRQTVLTNLLSRIELPGGDKRLPLPAEKPKLLTKPLYIPNETVDNLYFYIDTFMNRQMTDTELDALNLLNMMLTETLFSKILGTAREHGLVYGMSSGVGQTKASSNWWFGAQILPQNSTALFDIITRELRAACTGKISDEDIEATKQYALGRYQRSGQTVGGTAAGYAGRYFFDGVIDDYYAYPQRYKAVTKDAIVNIANEFFKQNVWGFGTLGSAGQQFTDDLHRHLVQLWK